MFKKILVCLDGSKLAEAILPYAVEEGQRFNGELVLFRAFSEPSTISLALPGMPGVPIDTRAKDRALVADEQETENYLQALAAKLQAETGLTVSYAEVLGAAGPAIVTYCGQQNIELVTIATHGRSGLGRVMLGSVADHVIRHSNVPILLIRPPEGS